ncbi:MAG: hypothetical protein CVU81_00945 [Euryarchaeota archaeon HGW-Euryarchaeota-1]|nr:MAG: hypothetical protein CVU81_00945 [Euryarchaeota archaeon HGW-Euryarchaeota-1]
MAQKNLFIYPLKLPCYLLSIRKNPANAILEGVKPHEFRRRFKEYEGQIRVFLYVVAPDREVIGEVVFDEPIKGNPEQLYGLLEGDIYNKKDRLEKYIGDCKTAYALPVVSFRRFKKPASVEDIRNVFNDFNPPQSYLNLEKPKYSELKNFLEQLV